MKATVKTIRRLYLRVLITFGVIFVWTSLFLKGTEQEYGLEVWLDTEQAKTLGFDIPVYIIHNGEPSAILKENDGHFAPKHMFKLSRDVQYLNITWRAPSGYRYSVEKTISYDHQLLKDPHLVVPSVGVIPRLAKVLQIAVPCTGNIIGVASSTIAIKLTQSADRLTTPKQIKSSPVTLLFNIQKECKKACKSGCLNGGHCDEWGICDCPNGYYGPICHQVLCNPRCFNGGTCISPGVCVCPKGFSGQLCQKAACDGECNQHGRCIGPDQCFCYKQWTGRYCEIRKQVPQVGHG